MKILRLTLTKKWFHDILSRKKREEYREMKSYWYRRFRTGKKNGVCFEKDCTDCYYNNHPQCKLIQFDAVEFTHGYGKGKPSFIVKLNSICVSYGNPEQGAPKNKKCFILSLGEIISTKNIKQ